MASEISCHIDILKSKLKNSENQLEGITAFGIFWIDEQTDVQSSSLYPLPWSDIITHLPKYSGKLKKMRIKTINQ